MILVTGGLGMIGAHTARALVHLGQPFNSGNSTCGPGGSTARGRTLTSTSRD